MSRLDFWAMVAWIALAVAFIAPAAWGLICAYFWLWGIPWPGQSGWTWSMIGAAAAFGGIGLAMLAIAAKEV